MKQLAQAIKHRDAVQLSLIAQSHPEKKHEPIPQQAVDVFNDLFNQLRATFPAMMATIKDQEQLNELRRQWVKAIAENHIYHSDQIEAGMKRARKHEKPFLPSPGEFISWCKEAETKRYGLPDERELFDSVMKFRANRFKYQSIEEYPWHSNEEYWLVSAVSSQMTSLNLSVTDALKTCKRELTKLIKKLNEGFIVPDPIPQIIHKHIPASKEVALNHIANLKAMLKSG